MVDPWFDDVSKRWAIGCGRCGASSGRSIHAEGSKEAAIKSWNTRGLTGTPAQPAPDILQEIHDAVNALGGRSDQDDSYDQGIVDTVSKVLDIIEKRRAPLADAHECLSAGTASARNDAQAKADFWASQAEKQPARRDHFDIVSSQFQKIADALTSTERQAVQVTPEMVKAVHDAKCFACGAFPYDDCQRHPQRDCGREFQGGSRAASQVTRPQSECGK